jgi:hypothetical protein
MGDAEASDKGCDIVEKQPPICVKNQLAADGVADGGSAAAGGGGGGKEANL